MKYMNKLAMVICIFIAECSVAEEYLTQAIGLEQLFTDGKRHAGTVTVAGPVSVLEIERSPFDDSITHYDLSIGEKGRKLNVITDKEKFDFSSLKIGQQIAITGITMLTSESSGFIKGNIVKNKYVVGNYTASNNISTGFSENSEPLTVKKYFDENMRIGSKKILLHGKIQERKIVGDGSVLFVLEDAGRIINAYSDFNINSNKDKLKSATEGTEITLLGSFDIEPGSIGFSIFTFKEIK